jgi:hypothetical protein
VIGSRNSVSTKVNFFYFLSVGGAKVVDYSLSPGDIVCSATCRPFQTAMSELRAVDWASVVERQWASSGQ